MIRDSQLWLAALVGLGFSLLASRWGIASTEVGGAVTVILAYAGVAFGFCLTGLTIAMTLPDEGFVHKLANLEPTESQQRKKGRRANAYSDLLFVFSWTAVAHWLVIVAGLAMLAGGYDDKLISGSYDIWERVKLGLFATLVLYAVVQFLITMITLSQVGNRYVEHLRASSDQGDNG